MNIYPRVGLGVLIFNDRNELLLGKRLAAHGELTWGPPGGHLEFGESFEDGAIREVLEETGLVIKEPEFVSITNDVFEKENKHYVSIFMKAIFPKGQEVKNNEPDKVEEWQWFELSNLPSNLFLPLEKLINNKSYGKNFSELSNFNDFCSSKKRYIKEVDNNIIISEPANEEISKIIVQGLKEYNKSLLQNYLNLIICA